VNDSFVQFWTLSNFRNFTRIAKAMVKDKKSMSQLPS
jgi:hypothetical protein